MAHELTYWSPEMIKPAIDAGARRLRVGSEQGKNDIVIPGLDPQHFQFEGTDSVASSRAEVQVKVRDQSGGRSTWIDGVALDHAAKYNEMALDKPVFLSDDPSTPTFVLGFDPESRDMWSLPRDRRGAEVRLDKVTMAFPDGGGVRDISATLRPCEFVGLYGGSGAGKTTLVEVILGLLSLADKPLRGGNAGGAVFVDGRETNGPKGSDRNGMGDRVAYLPQNVCFPEHLTCDELLRLAASDRGFSEHDIERVMQPAARRFDVFERCGLDGSVRGKRVGHLSGGERRRLALAVTLLQGDLSFLIVDEPTAGLDPESEQSVLHTLRRISRQGVTVLMVTHAVAALPHFDRVILLRRPSAAEPASVSFCGAWAAQTLAEYDQLRGASDAEALAFLVSHKSAGPFPHCIRPGDRPWFGPAASTEPAGEQQTGDPVGAHWPWFRACLTAIWREGRPRHTPQKRLLGIVPVITPGRGLLSLGLLGLLSVVALQHGAPPERSWLLLVLFCVAAPWLVATYSAVFAATFLPFFAFESLAGVRAGRFVRGLWLASTLPAFLVSAVFAAGAFAALDWGGPIRNLVCLESRAPWHRLSQTTSAGDPAAPQPTDSTRGCFLRAVCPLSLVRRFSPEYGRQAGRAAFDGKEWVASPIREVSDEMTNLFPAPLYPADATPGSPYGSAAGFLRVWLVLFGLCMAGSAFGMACLAHSFDARRALVWVVAVFIVFLSFSRAMVTESEQVFFAPLLRMCSILSYPTGAPAAGDVQEADDQLCADGKPARLGSRDSRRIVPIMLSCFSLPRYGFNLLVYQPEEGQVGKPEGRQTRQAGGEADHVAPSRKAPPPSFFFVMAAEACMATVLFIVVPLGYACRKLSDGKRLQRLLTRGDVK